MLNILSSHASNSSIFSENDPSPAMVMSKSSYAEKEISVLALDEWLPVTSGSQTHSLTNKCKIRIMILGMVQDY